ncbi:zinc-dependent alcohol dehydrogenase [Aeromicrobium endophyticum]|nr:zinc-binding alcohol dehydrogenase [Aeromicrobium endophyticum]
MSSNTNDGAAQNDARAVWFVAPREVELRSEPIGAPGPEDINVRAITSLVSAGTEMSVYHGTAGSKDAVDLPTTGGSFPFPLKFAYQIVGEVEEAGDRSGFSVGDRVFAYHPHQELFTIGGTSGFVFPVHGEASAEQAAFTNLYSVAYNALLDTPVRIGDVVVVSGLGVIGTFLAHLCRADAGTLILVDPMPSRRERAAWIGADAVVSPDEAAAVIEELSAGRGNDLWFEASGAPAALQSAVDNTGQEGTITVVSFYGNKPVTLQLGLQFHFRRQRIVSSQISSIGSGLQPRWDWVRRYDVAQNRLASFDVDKLVTHRVSIDDASDAYRLIDQHADETLAVLLDYPRIPSSARSTQGA